MLPHMKTLFKIDYQESGLALRMRIPAGTPVRLDASLPRGAGWALPWAGMTRRERQYLEGPGVLILACEMGEDLPNFELLP